MIKIKKNYMILATIIISAFLLGSLATAAPPEESSLLSDVWDYIFGIEEEVDDLQDQLLLLTMIDDLEDRIEALENDPGTPGPLGPTGPIGPPGPDGSEGPEGPIGPSWIQNPDYDTGWIDWSEAVTIGNRYYIEHDLGTDDLFVYVLGRAGGVINHQLFLGGEYYAFPADNFQEIGLIWQTMGPDEIELTRYADPEDTYWDDVRVLIWELPPPPT